jgi:hypothetical protein
MSTLFRLRNLEKTLDAQNARTGEIAPNWNVSGTHFFVCSLENAFLRRSKLELRGGCASIGRISLISIWLCLGNNEHGVRPIDRRPIF